MNDIETTRHLLARTQDELRMLGAEIRVINKTIDKLNGLRLEVNAELIRLTQSQIDLERELRSHLEAQG